MNRPIEHRYLRQWHAVKLTGTGTMGRLVGHDGLYPAWQIRGLVVQFGQRSKPYGGAWVEVIDPTAFAMNAGTGFPGVTARFDGSWFIGSTSGGTLRFTVGTNGLIMECDAPVSLPFVGEFCTRGDIQNVRATYEVYEDCWTHEKGLPVRHLVSARLHEVMLSTDAHPAVDTDVALSSLARQFGEPVELVTDLADREELWRLWGADHAPHPKKEREPILLGKHGRQAYVEVVGAKDNSSPVLDGYKVTATPADLASKG